MRLRLLTLVVAAAVMPAAAGAQDYSIAFTHSRTRDVQNGRPQGPVQQWAFSGFMPRGPEGGDISVTARLNEIRLVSTEDQPCVSPLPYLEAKRTTVVNPVTRQSLDRQLRRVDTAI